VDDILNLDENIIKEAKPCGLGAISMLFGVLSGAQADWDMITSTYEAPFGIGYLTASLGIKKTAD
jgi:aromatic ring-opening dioxygenase LigB subunit